MCQYEIKVSYKTLMNDLSGLQIVHLLTCKTEYKYNKSHILFAYYVNPIVLDSFFQILRN